MSRFLEELKLEIKREKTLVKNNTTILDSAPKGFLTARKRSKFVSYFWTFYEGHGQNRMQRQININNNPTLITQLADKRFSSVIVENCLGNLPMLEGMLLQYKDLDPSAVTRQCSGKYQDIFTLREKAHLEKWLAAPYSKAAFDPKRHTHTTDYGERVRSKSEQILANTLYAYGIPFHYEEEFFYSVGNIGKIYPDFTIFLPKGDIIIWEHLGMLSIEQYCINNARKLNIYQQNGFTIGENLILTMDDNNGNFSSAIINKTIHNEILPKLHGIQINKGIISQGIK